ncbi:DUF5132 domain-containing protein [Embleya sp. NPDC050154]|uniref:DUF5132 domain-containing protein n=1 Tax=Embleya sp. NPDC050154 TaxID=3363988 RepID=UPI003795A1ED
MTALPPFLLGLVLAPVAKRVVKPLVQGTIKTSINLVMEVKKAARQASEEFHDLAAEASAERFGAELREDEKADAKGTKTRPVAATAGAGGKS